ncbi:hypothetical protein HDK77DRAFT_80447 [Phyllosticta capitalensis]
MGAFPFELCFVFFGRDGWPMSGKGADGRAGHFFLSSFQWVSFFRTSRLCFRFIFLFSNFPSTVLSRSLLLHVVLGCSGGGACWRFLGGYAVSAQACQGKVPGRMKERNRQMDGGRAGLLVQSKKRTLSAVLRTCAATAPFFFFFFFALVNPCFHGACFGCW